MLHSLPMYAVQLGWAARSVSVEAVGDRAEPPQVREQLSGSRFVGHAEACSRGTHPDLDGDVLRPGHAHEGVLVGDIVAEENPRQSTDVTAEGTPLCCG